MEPRVDELPQHDEEDTERIAANVNQQAHGSCRSDFDAADPSDEATSIAATNGNGFSDSSEPLGRLDHMQPQYEKVTSSDSQKPTL